MQRVLKVGGKLVIWDMEATSEDLRDADDEIEKMRDASHIRILSKAEFEALYRNSFNLIFEEMTLVPVNLQKWMDLTDTPTDVQEKIIERMDADLSGGAKTGFNPYIKDEQIWFDHRWLLLVGIKR